MALLDFDWSTFIAEMVEIPTDVIFQIVEDGELHEIKAHKTVMGMISPTFKTMFYTTDVGDKTVKEVKIDETTKNAFQIIIDYLYTTKSIEDSLQGRSLQEIFDVVNLIERYQMSKLQKAMDKLLSNYPITDDTVLEVAAEAIHQRRLFQKEAQQILLSCAAFLMPKLKDVKSILKYFKENEDQKDVVAALLVLMNDIAPSECSNCGYKNCRDGKVVKEGEFREGLLVTINPDTTDFKDYGTGIVTEVDGAVVAVGCIKGGITQNGVTGYQFQGNRWNKSFSSQSWCRSDSSSFIFVCN